MRLRTVCLWAKEPIFWFFVTFFLVSFCGAELFDRMHWRIVCLWAKETIFRFFNFHYYFSHWCLTACIQELHVYELKNPFFLAVFHYCSFSSCGVELFDRLHLRIACLWAKEPIFQLFFAIVLSQFVELSCLTDCI